MHDSDVLIRFTLQVAAAAVDEALITLWELAPQGFEEHDAGAGDMRFVLYAEPDEAPTLSAALLELVDELGMDGGPAQLDEDRIANENWREAWKVNFTLQRIGRFVIRPSWIEYTAAPGEHVIHLDPGAAFGSGLHETTRLCLQALDALAAESRRFTRVLDFGTGTGILGIAATRLWSCEVWAVDDDPLALQACQENAERNDVAARFTLRRALPPPAPPYDLVLANIQRPVLLEHSRALTERLAPGGELVLSGLLTGDEAEIRAAYQATGCGVRERTQDKDWIALRVARESP